MTDDMLNHMCKLSTVTVDMIRNPENGITAPEVSDRDLRIMLMTLADTFVELQRRQGIKPHFGRNHIQSSQPGEPT